MSGEPLRRVALVCEGPTDYVVIKAIVEMLVHDECEVNLLQPEYSLYAGGDHGRLGGGWKGVRRWCAEHAPLSHRLRARPLDAYALLIVHVDADIAGDQEINCRRDCPPAADTADALRDVIVGWGAEETVPERVVLCVPSKATDAWVVVALYPNATKRDEDIECRRKPESLLKQRPEKLVSGPRNKKNVAAYRAVAPLVTAAWGRVTSVCTQADRFSTELAEALA